MDDHAQPIADPRVLIVDDDPELTDILASGLEAAGLDVAVAASLPEARAILDTEAADLLLLDLEVAGDDGMNVLRELRSHDNPLPVIIMTGSRVETEHAVSGLESGADDYVLKPFAIPEILARIRAVYRRHQGSREASCRAGDLTIDRLHRQVECRGRMLNLTLRELELLALLARNAGREVSRDDVRSEVWSESAGSTTFDNTLDVHISRLRKKLNECGSSCEIRTVWGKGFLLHVETV